MVVMRQFARPALLAATAVALVFTACLPPVAFHDGLPAWSPEPGQAEWRVGYQRLSAFGADSFDLLGVHVPSPNVSLGYLTPGVRWGLSRTPYAADAGLTSVITTGSEGLSLLVGPTFGVGRCDSTFGLMFRPSIYLLSFGTGNYGGLSLGEWFQAEVLAGNGYGRGSVTFSAGGRVSRVAAGPIALVGVGLIPVDLRAELSYMLPISGIAAGQALTVGITAAAPARRQARHSQDRQ